MNSTAIFWKTFEDSLYYQAQLRKSGKNYSKNLEVGIWENTRRKFQNSEKKTNLKVIPWCLFAISIRPGLIISINQRFTFLFSKALNAIFPLFKKKMHNFMVWMIYVFGDAILRNNSRLFTSDSLFMLDYNLPLSNYVIGMNIVYQTTNLISFFFFFWVAIYYLIR